MKLGVLVPFNTDVENEITIIESQRSVQHPIENVKPCVTSQDIITCQNDIVDVHVERTVLEYMLQQLLYQYYVVIILDVDFSCKEFAE